MQTNKEAFTVTELTRYVKSILGQNSILNNLWVRGEISNFKHHPSGHMYFTIKDQGSNLRCIMFQNRNRALDFSPKDGMKVLARGAIGVFERAGLYQLYVEELKPDGIGDLYLAFEKLKSQLQKEGLFNKEFKKSLPSFPGKIALVTSPSGAAIRDMIVTIIRRFPGVEIKVVPVRVQGEMAAKEIVRGIELASLCLEPDVILLGRGGGSLEELWPFNEEAVARAIFSCNVPIVSCVGHETDYTISDFVGDVRAPTPTAAGEIIVPDQNEIKKYINENKKRMIASLRNKVNKIKEDYNDLTARKVLKEPYFIVEERRKELEYYSQRIMREKYHYFKDKRNELGRILEQLEALNPLAVLKRGYSICEDKEGNILKNARVLEKGQRIFVNFHDGKIDCSVIELYFKDNKEGYKEDGKK